MQDTSIIIHTTFIVIATMNALTAMGKQNWHSFGGWSCAILFAIGQLSDAVLGGAA